MSPEVLLLIRAAVVVLACFGLECLGRRRIARRRRAKEQKEMLIYNANRRVA